MFWELCWLVLGKEFADTAFHNILANLEHHERNGKKVSSFIDRIKKEYSMLSGTTDISQIMGIEGRVRDQYYSSFNSFLREGFDFDKRTKMPPQNMLNSLISFGNSLIYATILTEIYHMQLTEVAAKFL
jgi:CRISP-associated protein Cas1